MKCLSYSYVCNESSLVTIISCNFSPGLIPTSLSSQSGAIALAKSVILNDGILEINVSPPLASDNALITSFTPSSRLIQNLVILKSVIGSSFAPFLINSSKNGITEPRLPATLPYLTSEKLISCLPAYALAEINNLSDTNFVPPYRLTGLTALSVDSATTLFTPILSDALITFVAPSILVLIASNGLYSQAGTCFIAAA